MAHYLTHTQEDFNVKIKIDRQALISKLNHVTKALPIKTTISILTGIKFVTTEKGISLTGSDSDITINTSLPLEVFTEKGNVRLIEIEEAGGIVIPGKYFFEIIKKLEADVIEINTFDDTDILIRGDKGEYTLKGLPVENYPQIELSNIRHHFTMPTSELKTVVAQTLFSVALNESRPALTGVNFKYAQNLLSCTATDSFRLSQRTVTGITGDVSDFNVTIPGRSLSELGKTIDPNDPETVISITNNQILFKNGDMSFQSRLLEGVYPDVSTFIPTTFEIKVTIGHRELFNAVDRVSLMARENRANVAKISILPEENHMIIKSNSTEIGKIEEVVKIKEQTGSKLQVACSSIFLLDSLKATFNPDGDVTFGFNGDMKPFVVLDEQDDSNLQLIVPVRLED